MKRISCILLFAATLMMAACDPGYSEDVAFKNKSSHTVTITPMYNSQYDNDTTTEREVKSYTIEPNQEVVVESMDGLGGASYEQGTHWLKWYYGNEVELRFDDGKLVVYHPEDTTGISPYNYHCDNYTYDEKLKETAPFLGNPYYGKLTFSITDEHYGAAQ